MPYNSVTILILAYNEEQMISHTLDAVIETNIPNSNIVVIDDASSDNTPNILKLYKDKISIYRNSKFLGYGGSLIKGISVAKGDYIITYLPSDGITKSELTQLYDLRKKTDLILVNKIYDVKKEITRTPNYINFLNKLNTIIIYIKTNISLQNPLTTIKIINMYKLKNIELKKQNFEINIDLINEFYKKDYTITEISLPYSKEGNDFDKFSQ